VLRIAPTPRVEVDKADTVTVYASDRATGASVTGTVYVGNESYATGVQFQHTFCRRIFDPIKKRRVVDCDGRITVKAPGYTNPQYLLVAIPEELIDSTEPADPNPPR